MKDKKRYFMTAKIRVIVVKNIQLAKLGSKISFIN